MTTTPKRVTHGEAERIAQAYIDHAFRNDQRDVFVGMRIRHSIPADEERDTDIRLHAYIQQQKEAEKSRRADVEVVRRRHVPCTVKHADCGNCRATEALDRLAGECEG